MKLYLRIRREGPSVIREVIRVPPTSIAAGSEELLKTIGPFRTVQAVKFAVHCWSGNPLGVDVKHCERMGREFKDQMRTLPEFVRRAA